MKCMEEGYLTGQMEGNLMEHSFKVSWREMEHMNGKMGENILDNIRRIKSMERAPTTILMGVN